MAASTSADTASSPILLQDCSFIDLVTGARAMGDVSIVDGLIDRVGPHLEVPTGGVAIPMGGDFVVPGWVDIHAHVFYGVGESVHPDEACLGRGTVLAVDAGTAGSATINAFRNSIAGSQTEVLAFLNLSTVGLTDTSVGELIPGPFLNVGEAIAAVERHRGFIVGIKARLSSYAAGQGAIRILRVLRQLADEVRLPAMVHVGDTQEDLAEILPYLRSGDVVTHALTGRRHGILDGRGSLLPAVIDAQAAGVVFDSARGRNHLSFDVLARAIEQGFLPDTLSTDISLGLSGTRSYGMATLGNYLLAYAVPLHKVLSRMAITPAAVVGRHRDPVLTSGAPANLTAMRIESTEQVLEDVDGRLLDSGSSIVATGTVRNGKYRRIPETHAEEVPHQPERHSQ